MAHGSHATESRTGNTAHGAPGGATAPQAQSVGFNCDPDVAYNGSWGGKLRHLRQDDRSVAHSANDDGSGEDGPPVQRTVDRLWVYSHPPQIHHNRHKNSMTASGRTHRGGAGHQTW